MSCMATKDKKAFSFHLWKCELALLTIETGVYDE